MSDTNIKIYNNFLQRKAQKSKTYKLEKSILGLQWVNKLKTKIKKNIESPIFIKKDLEAEEMIEKAEIHRQANRPLKKIKEFDGLTRFCQCCYNPMKDQIHVTNFNICDDPSEFAEFGIGISFLFSYLRYSCLILLFSFCLMAIPNLYLSKKHTDEIINICKTIYSRDGDNINTTLPYCNGFINMNNNNLNKYNNQMNLLFKFNSMNLRQYQEIYYNLTNNKDNIDKILVNYHLIVFMSLIALFIMHSLYTIILFNTRKEYDMSVTSPGDYAIIITNLKSTFKIFSSEINRINELIKDNNNNKKYDLLSNNFSSAENDPNSSRKIFEIFHEIGIEKLIQDNEINMLEGFNEFLRNKICRKKNNEQYDIYIINICYKINEFISIQEKIKEKSSEIYKAKNDPEQLRKNMSLDLSKKDYRFFYHPLDIFDLYICPFTLYERSLKITDIEHEKQQLEEKLKIIMKDTENLTENNFAGVAFIVFNSMKEKDKFLKIHNKNLIMKIIESLSNLKYYLFYCCINSAKRKEYFLKSNISIEIAPEPEDIIYENLEFSWKQRYLRVVFAYIISFILIAICFIFILLLNSLQIQKSKADNKNNKLNRYIVSISISLCIIIIDSIFEKILIILTKVEKQISMTNYFLSFSIKLTFLTFLISAIIPFLSSYFYGEQLNHDMLITNCFTMFLSNSFFIPITWTINFDFFLKKLRRYIIKKKKKHLPQNELNTLYELLDMDIASKYSYVAKTLLMTFFYLPIFPFGLLISCFGFLFAYFLEKYNFVKQYKKPIMLNSRIYEIYSNYFVFDLFIVSLGEYLFLKDVFISEKWLFVNISLFGILFIFPYNNILAFDLIGISESDIKAKELYEDYFYNFFNDYERNNPITKKEGIKHFLDTLLEKVLITQKDADTIFQNYEHMNLLEIYYKSKLNFGYNLMKRAFFQNKLQKNENHKENLDSSKIKSSKILNNLFQSSNSVNKSEKNNQKDSENVKEEQIQTHDVNIIRGQRKRSKFLTAKNSRLINICKDYKSNKIIKNRIKKNNNKLILRKDIIKRDSFYKSDVKLSQRNTIEKDENNESINIMNIKSNKNSNK